ncbi:MAG: glycosyltransferase family 2 protein [Thermodesulfobacteriota bacterium]|nr:glycosyltransferase family 2 protein [Thermodesulfobacteriota bacterium]
MMINISVCMITFNNERTVERALKSVLPWANEIIVVDSFSTDETPKIAQQYASHFEKRHWPGHMNQYNYCISKAKNEWVIFIDADEEISPKLAKEMMQRIETDNGKYDGYIIHRRTFYLGRWIMHGGWVPDYEIRLFRKSKGAFEGGLHAKVSVCGKVGTLTNFYFHYNYKDIADQIDTINNYSDTAARDMIAESRRFSYIDLIFRPPFRFIKEYFFKRGFMDGLPGFVIAVSTVYYVFIKYAKLWELKNNPRKRNNSED